MADVIPSEELRSFLLRLYATWEALDFDALREMVSAKPHALVVGTDPTEWWSGCEGLDMWLVQVQEPGPVTIRSAGPVAYCCGNVGKGTGRRLRAAACPYMMHSPVSPPSARAQARVGHH